MNLNTPIISTINPEQKTPPGPEFARVRLDITQGVPARLPFEPNGRSALLVLATGLIREWLADKPVSDIASSLSGLEPADTTSDLEQALTHARDRSTPRILFIHNKRITAICPLVTGVRVLLPLRASACSAGLEIEILSYRLNAAALAGIRPAGGHIELGWRDIVKGTDEFDALVCRSAIRHRISYLTGTAEARERVSVDAQFASGSEQEQPGGGIKGGLHWRQYHGR